MIIYRLIRILPFPLLLLFFLAGKIAEEKNIPFPGQPGMIHLSLAEKKSDKSAPSITVTWCSAVREGSQFIKYGITPGLERTSRAEKKDFNEEVILTCVLKNLKHNTKYFYICGSDNAGWSPLYSFVTEPEHSSNTSFRVGIFGDTQNNTLNEEFQKTRYISGLIQNYSPGFTLHMGDIVDNGSVTSNWKGFLSVTRELNATAPLMPVLGNHDVENKPGEQFQSPFPDFYNLFNLPGDEINYSFTYKNVRFIGIFSGCAEAAARTDQVKYKTGSPEYIWLDEELSRAENDKNIVWTVVYMHYPVYSFGWSNIAKWREAVLPLFEKHRIDLCLAGHRHVYERHAQLKNGIPVPNISGTAFTTGKGTIYITNGTAGGNPTGTGGKDLPTMMFTPDEKIYSFAIMDISDESITYRVFNQDNILIDWFTLNKK